MEIVLVILAFILLIIGLLGAVVPILPGPPLSFLGLLVLQWSGRGGFSVTFLIILGGIAAIITVMDYFLPSMMAKKFGGSRKASVGSFLGVLAGMFFFPPWGILIGPFIGALAGELIHNREDGKKAVKVAFGSLLSFLVGAGAKLIASGIMIFYAVRAVFL